jgi:nucleoid-associated protein YgaU
MKGKRPGGGDLGALEAAFAKDPKNREALEALKRAYAVRGAWPRFIEVMRRDIALEPDPARKLEKAAETARLAEAKLEPADSARVLAELREVARGIDPSHPLAAG